MTLLKKFDEVVHQFLSDAGDALMDPPRSRSCLLEIQAALAWHLGIVEDLLRQSGESDVAIVKTRSREMEAGARNSAAARIH